MKRNFKAGISLIITIMLVLAVFPATVFAADATVRYGSEQYEVSVQEAFYIGVYIESESNIGDFDVQLSYNPQFLTYVTGATTGGDGNIGITGTVNGTSIKYLVAFQAIAGGDTSLNVVSATVQNADSQETLKVSTYASAPIYIAPNANAKLQGITINGKTFEAFQPDSMSYAVDVEMEDNQLEIEADAPGCTTEISDTTISNETKPVYITVHGTDDTTNIYTLNVTRTQVAADSESETAHQASSDVVTTDTEKKSSSSSGRIILIVILVLVLFAAAGYVGLMLYDKNRRMHIQKKHKQNHEAEDAYDAEVKDDNESHTKLYKEVHNSFENNAIQSEMEPLSGKNAEEKNIESQIAEAMHKAQKQATNDQRNQKLDAKKQENSTIQRISAIDKMTSAAPTVKPERDKINLKEVKVDEAKSDDTTDKITIDKTMIDVSFISQELEKRINHKEES